MQKQHLLVVDDEAQIRMSLFVLLSDAGFRVTTARDGREALERVAGSKKSSEQLDLLLTDIRMPGLGGIELIDELRRRRLTVPIMIITAYKSDHLMAELSQRGRFELIEKPYDPRELVERIEALLQDQRIQEE